MSRWLLVLFVIAAVGLLWFRQRERRSVELQRRDDARLQRDAVRIAERQPATAASAAPVTGGLAARDDHTDKPADDRPEPVSRPLQEAAEAATGRDYLEAAAQLREQSADLAAARHRAERAAETLAQEADAALLAVQAAAAAQGGAVPGDGSPDCPAGYPIKGDLTARHFVEPGAPDFDSTVPAVCFQSVAAAESAGFVAAASSVMESPGGRDGRAAGIVAGEVTRAHESGADVVAEAMEAASAESAPPGAVRGDGGRDCPPTYPIKGNKTSMLYHEPSSRSYAVTIPEFCFSSTDAAEAAGYSPPRR